jgi:hypothetical protein
MQIANNYLPIELQFFNSACATGKKCFFYTKPQESRHLSEEQCETSLYLSPDLLLASCSLAPAAWRENKVCGAKWLSLSLRRSKLRLFPEGVAGSFQRKCRVSAQKVGRGEEAACARLHV